VKNRKLVEKLQTDFSLGQGEAEAIALAQKEELASSASMIRMAINACKAARYCLHHRWGHPASEAAKRFARSWRRTCWTRGARQIRTLQEFHHRRCQLKLEVPE